MSIDYASLIPGQVISDRTYRLDSDAVAAYVDAVDDRSGLITGPGGRHLAPSMAIAALSLRGVVSELAVPGGSLHTGQEIEFKGAVEVGKTLHCLATVVANSVRREWRVLVVKLQVTGSGGRVVMAGKSTIMIPA